VRAICTELGAACDARVAPHLLSLLSVAPELEKQIAVPPELRASFAFSREGNLPEWTRRVAHGVTDFLLDVLEEGSTVLFLGAEQADPTDREFIETLQRRSDPMHLRCQFDAADAAPADDLAAPRALLEAGARLWGGAYDDHGDDPIALLLQASDLCMRMAYYDAALEWAQSGRALAARGEDYGKLTRNALFALLLLGRIPEAEAICREMQQREPDPALLAHVTYVMAILNVRLYDPARHDYDAAKAWVERSLDFTDRLPPSETRAVNRAFLMNTMALVEMRKGHHGAAFDLLNTGLAHMEEYAPTKYRLECGILLHNRARLHVAARQPDRALDDLTQLLQLEPSNSDAWFDRGRLQQNSGDHAAAIEDYDAALRWSPPYWQPYFNRALALVAQGCDLDAVADYRRVMALQPAHLDARIHLADLHLRRDEAENAAPLIIAALNLAPGNARAVCLRGLLELGRGDLAAALASFSAALAADPQLPDAWANRASIHFKQGALELALNDLDRALALREDGDVRYNRGRIHEAMQDWSAAIAEYRRALTLGAARPEQVQRHLDHCVVQNARRVSLSLP